MKILVGIWHPAHVHFFRNFISLMEKRGHTIKVISLEKEINELLMNKYNIKYEPIGKNEPRTFTKMKNTLIFDKRVYYITKGFKPDIMIGIAAIFFAHVGKLLRIPSIIFTDTEHAKLINCLTFPFADVICTPSCFKKDLGKKQVRYNGYHELAYLHPDYFKPNPAVLDEIGLSEDDKFFILRFVSWEASHDIRHSGLTIETKRELINLLSKYGKVFISSEKTLPKEFEKYRITVSPEKMHDVLYYATLLYGESATMASECAILGTPAIFVDFAGRGYTDEEEEKYGLVYNFGDDLKSQEKSIEKVRELLQNEKLKKEWQKKREKLLKDKIDVTKWMVKFVEEVLK